MRFPLLPLLLLTVVLGTGSASADEGRFRTLRIDGDTSMEKGLAAPGAEGYGLVAAARGFGIGGRPRIELLMENRGHPVQYVVLQTEERLDTEAQRRSIAALGRRGCRLERDAVLVERIAGYWLPDHAADPRVDLIFQCEAGAPPLEYEVVVFGEGEAFQQAIGEHRAGGFELIGVWNTRRFLQAVLRRGPEQSPRGSRPESRWFYYPTLTSMRFALEDATWNGFRVMAADDPSAAGPPMMYLERTERRAEFSYKVMGNLQSKIRRGALEKKLNRHGRVGWKLIERGSTADAMLLANNERNDSAFEYRVVSSRTPPGLAAAVEREVADGYRIGRLLVAPAETLVVLVRDKTDR